MNKNPVIALTLMLLFVIPGKFSQGQEKKAEGTTKKGESSVVKKIETGKKPDTSPEKKYLKKNNKVEAEGTDKVKPESMIPKKRALFKKTGKVAGIKSITNPKKPERIEGILLFIKEGSYKYKRIPGYKTEEKTAQIVTEEKDEKIIKIPDRIEVDEIEKEGLFGMSKEKTDLLVKGGFIFLISLIFILYKIRSRRSSHKVLRRFPNK